MATTPRLGGKVRALRRRQGMTQKKLAQALGISASYLNLIEHNRRPLSASLLIELARTLEVDLDSFASESDARILTELMEALGDPLFESLDLPGADVRELLSAAPSVAEAMLLLYRAYRNVRDSAESLSTRLSGDLDLPGVDRSRLPPEEVSDFIQRHLNHFPDLEAAAEELWLEAKLDADQLDHDLIRYLSDSHGVRVRVVKAAEAGPVVRRFDSAQRLLVLSESLPMPSRTFQLAHTVALLARPQLLSERAEDRGLSTHESQALGRVAMANYMAGAILMPYEAILQAAREERYDVALLGNRFGASFEQICHRLTTLRRPGAEGIPFHFVRVDIAGNISKRFSASGIQISRFGGSCPRWNLHTAFLTPGQICVQLAKMTDGKLYLSIARAVSHGARGFHAPPAIHAVALGCEAKYAGEMVYSDGIDLDNREAAVPIGATCRMCDRLDRDVRAFPSLQQPLKIDANVRGISFYTPVGRP